MTSNQTMDYYVRPRHLYSHSRTCTRSGLCRRLSILVASLICYLLDCASVHEISALVTWFQYMLDISSYYGDLDPFYIFSYYGDHGPLYIFIMEILIYVYCTWRWPLMWYLVSCLFMAIVLLCIQDCYMYLQLCAELYHCTMLIGWLVFHFRSFITPLLGYTYNVFRPSYDPSDLIRGNLGSKMGLIRKRAKIISCELEFKNQ